MDRRVFHGAITPADVAQALLAEFNRGNLRAQAMGESDRMVVQVATRPGSRSGGDTALTISIEKCEDGVMAEIGQQAWFGLAASLGTTALWALRNPLSLLGRLDDVAQDIENLQLSEHVWQVIAGRAKAAGASTALSERLRRVVCEYCGTANPTGEPSCLACGAPLGRAQPDTCPNCGFVVKAGEVVCPNCERRL